MSSEQPLDKAKMIVEIPIEKVVPNPHQVRKLFDPDGIQELANSIQRLGLLEPILVRPKDDQYEIVHGERRWRACKLIGLRTIGANIKQLTEDEAFEIGLVENIQRENLTPVEEAFAIKSFLDRGLRQGDVAERIGKMKKKLAERLKILSSHYYTQYQEEEIERLRKELDSLKKKDDD